MRRVVVLLARAPSAKGKTRLTAALPESAARDLRERLLLDTLDGARATELPVLVCFTPESAREEMRRLAPDVELFAQSGDDLGERMRNAIDFALGHGADLVALIGSDLPSLPSSYIQTAFKQLESADVVLGPTDDGGFYLIAARRPLPDLFHGMTWSHADVLRDVVRAANRHQLTVALAPPWWDLDRPEDLRRVLTQSGASAPDAACGPAIARRVRGFLERGN